MACYRSFDPFVCLYGMRERGIVRAQQVNDSGGWVQKATGQNGEKPRISWIRPSAT